MHLVPVSAIIGEIRAEVIAYVTEDALMASQ
jgi:hypothetical protein